MNEWWDNLKRLPFKIQDIHFERVRQKHAVENMLHRPVRIIFCFK